MRRDRAPVCCDRSAIFWLNLNPLSTDLVLSKDSARVVAGKWRRNLDPNFPFQHPLRKRSATTWALAIIAPQHRAGGGVNLFLVLFGSTRFGSVPELHGMFSLREDEVRKLVNPKDI